MDRQLEGENVEDAIELAVAQLYRLPADEYEIIADSFKLDREKRGSLVGQYREKVRMEKRKP